MHDRVSFDFSFMKLTLCEFGYVAEEYYTASAEVCPPNWQTFYEYEIGSALKRKRCVQKVEQTASFYQAQTICRQQRAFIVPVVIRLSPDGNKTDPFAYLPRTGTWRSILP